MHRVFVGIVPLGFIILGLVSSASAQEVERTGNIFHKAVCGFVVGHAARCHSHVITNSSGRAISNKQIPVGGYGPSDLRDAYKVTATGAASTIIAIVDAYGYTNAETDLNTYRKYFGLPACTQKNGCFKKFNQNGKQKDYPAQDNRWAGESALDLDMASAMCPNCALYLVEANSSSISDLAAAANTSAKLGARAISNSYGGDEAGSQTYESAYNHPGIAVTVSSGDSGYAGGVQFPASSPHLTAVGGTYLVRDGSARGWNEKVWSGAGSGCSSIYSKPSWQHDSGCSNRTVADVSAVASDRSPVAVYGPDKDTGQSQWEQWSGTSVAAPIIAGIYAANGGLANYGSDPYTIQSAMFDVTSGSTGICNPSYLCHGKNGYDGPSGLGTPSGTMGVGQFVKFDVTGSIDTIVSEINAFGAVAGSWEDSHYPYPYHAFLRTLDGTITTMDPPDSEEASADCINAAGTIAGSWGDAAGEHGFVRTADGSITKFDIGTGRPFTIPQGINNAGTIVGVYFDSVANANLGFIRSSDGTVNSFGFDDAYLGPNNLKINSSGVVSGYYQTKKGKEHSFVRALDGTITVFDEPDSPATIASNINKSGTIIGSAKYAFLRAPNGSFTDIDVPDDYVTSPSGINTTGTITGAYTDNVYHIIHGFIRAANGTISTFDVPGAEATAPMSINASGVVAGIYTTSKSGDGRHGFLGSP